MPSNLGLPSADDLRILAKQLGDIMLKQAEDYVKDGANAADLKVLGAEWIKAIFTASGKKAVRDFIPLPPNATMKEILERERALAETSEETQIITSAILADADRVARLRTAAYDAAKSILWKAVGLGIGFIVAG